MRPRADADNILAFARELGDAATDPARLYLTGGATAVLEGWRATTVDIDIRLEPDANELLRQIPRLKESLGVNVELASPADFIPELPEWRITVPGIANDPRFGGRLSSRDRLWSEGSDPRG